MENMAPQSEHTILDVGAKSDRNYDHSNYFEAWYPNPACVTATGIDDASFLEQVFPGMRFAKADGRNLPFADCSFDFVHSSAVLEHVGSSSQQLDFLKELWRVARRGIFLTPNRWFPIEFIPSCRFCIGCRRPCSARFCAGSAIMICRVRRT